MKFLLKKAVLAEKFESLKGEKLSFFALKEARQRGLTITSGAIDFLIKESRGNTWRLINELEKLSLY